MFEILIAALIMVESSGDPNAVNGDAVGILQIRPICLRDVNRISSGPLYLLRDRYNIEKSKQMCRIYLNHYATEKRLGHEPTMEDCARIWNGGPNGWQKRATEKYWEDVKWALEKQK